MASHSSVVGGSSAGRVLACPGSVKLARTVPPAPASDYANEGTMLHELAEALLNGAMTLDQCEGYTAAGVACTAEHLPVLELAIEMCDALLDRHFITHYTTEVKVDWSPHIPGAFGWVDILATGPAVNLVIDWKFGGGVPVSAENNPQGLFYATGAMLTPALREFFDPDKPTIIAIIQPRISHQPSCWMLEPAVLAQFRTRLVNAIKDDQTLVAGTHCRWCPAKPVCPAKIGLARSLPEYTRSDQLGELLDLAAEVSDWADGLRAYAQQALEAGHQAAGWKLVAKRAQRKWSDEKLAEEFLLGLDLPLDAVAPRKLLSPAQAERLAEEPLPSNLIRKTVNGTTIATADDKRPAILPRIGVH